MRKIILAGTVLLSTAVLADGVVSNVAVAQDAGNRVVTVTYDLADEAIVTVELFADGEKIDARGVWAGEVSKVCACGTGKKAYWRIKDNLSADPSALTARVNAWTESNPPDYLSVDFTSRGKRYYASTNELPYPVTSDYYRRHAMLFRRIPAKGVTFWMGSPESQATTRKANENYHKVTLTNDFYIGVFPVTQAQWKWAMNSSTGNPSLQQDRPDSDLCPMDNISSYYTVGVFAGFPDGKFYVSQNPEAGNMWVASFQAKAALQYVSVPTEAQWEYACRAGEGAPTYDPAATYDELSWNSGNSGGRTHPVGLKKPNAWGLYDMLGNVWEHCLDHYQANLGTADVTMPYLQGNYCYKTCRGGAYDTLPGDCLSARRLNLAGRHEWGGASKRENCGVRLIIGIH